MHNSYNTAANFAHHNGGFFNYFYKAAFPGSSSSHDQNPQNQQQISNNGSGGNYGNYGNYEQKNNSDKDKNGRKKG